MKRLSVILLAFVIAFSFASCGKKTIRVVEQTYPNGKEKLVVHYSDDDAHEKLREEQYYPTGKLQSEGSFKNGLRDGVWRFWYQNGNLWSEGEFTEGKANGFRKVYYENSRLRYRGQYKDDQRTGEWEFYDENGKKEKVEKF